MEASMQRLLIVLFALTFASVGYCGSSGQSSPLNVDLNVAGSMDALARDNPRHHAKIVQILAEVQRLEPNTVARWLKAEFGADDVEYVPLLKTSDPAKRYLAFTLERTRYEVLLVVARTEPARAPETKLVAPTVTQGRQCKDEVRALISPEYPRSAIRAGIEQGWVWLRFDLDGSGQASNIRIVTSSPNSGSEDFPPYADITVRATEGKRTRLFDQSAVEWLERGTFMKGAKRLGCEIIASFLLK
jgi:hypothetical protein